MPNAPSLGGVGAFLGSSYSGIVRPEHADHLRLSSYCGIGTNRALADAGVLDILPAPYSQLGPLIRSGKIRCDVVMVQVSPPNARGEYSLGLAVDYLVPALDECRAVDRRGERPGALDHTEPLLRKDDFDLVRRELAAAGRTVDCKPPASSIARSRATPRPSCPTARCSNSALASCPTRCCGAARAPRPARPLRQRSATASSTSTCAGRAAGDAHADRLAAPVRLGARQPARAPALLRLHARRRGARAGIERFVAINSAVEVDLTGQVNGEVAGGSYVGAVGGALDFVRAANASPGGVSIVVLPAKRIVERLSGPVSVPRSEAGVVVTERGAADLRGCTLRERERRLRAIASGSRAAEIP